MIREKILTSTEVEKILVTEFLSFTKKWHGILTTSDIQTLTKYMEEVKEKLQEPVINNL